MSSAGMLNNAQLAALRVYAALTLDLTAKIERQTGTSQDSAGHVVENWTTLANAQPCRLAEPSETQLQLYASAIASRRAWKITLAYGVDVQRNDRVTIGVLVLRVQTSDVSSSSYSTAIQVIATEMN